ncbi:DUF2062 domain-containing protein [Elusimicrobiota bacterium]
MIRAKRALAGALVFVLPLVGSPPAARVAVAAVIATPAPVRAPVSVPAVRVGMGSMIGAGLSSPTGALSLTGPALPSATLPSLPALRPGSPVAAVVPNASALTGANGSALLRRNATAAPAGTASGLKIAAGPARGRPAPGGGLLRSAGSALGPLRAALKRGKLLTGAVPLLGRLWDGAHRPATALRETEARPLPRPSVSRLSKPKGAPQMLPGLKRLVRIPPPVEGEPDADLKSKHPGRAAWAKVRDLWRRTLGRSFTLDDTPSSIAKGVALGIMIAMSPTVGIQWLIVLPLSKLFRANMAAAFSVIWASNPLTMAPIYWLTYKIGRLIYTGGAISDGAWPALQEAFSAGLGEVLSVGLEAFLTTALGGLVLGAALAVPLYLLTRYGVRSYRKHKADKQEQEAPPS